MTEPRDPRAGEDESVPTDAPDESAVSDPGAWHIVDKDDTEPDPDSSDDPEPLAEPAEALAEPAEAPAEPAEAPAEPAEPEPPVSEWSDAPEPVSPAEVADVPAAPAEPEPPASEWSDAPEPPAEPADVPTEPTEVVPDAEPTEALPDGTEPTDVITTTDAEGTQRLVIADAPDSVPSAPAEAIFRPPSPTSAPSPEPTRVEEVSDEERRLAEERAARRDARVAAFAAPAPQPVVAPEPVIVHKRTNDRFWGSLGLFLLRIVLAGIFAIRGLNILTDIPAAEAQFAKTILADYPPGPQMMAIVTGVASLLIALSLLLGLLTRVAGLGIALIAGGALALVYWGPWSPFVAGQPGFLGEYELLLAAVGVLLLFVGAGGWSLDRSFRSGRERSKRERSAAAE